MKMRLLVSFLAAASIHGYAQPAVDRTKLLAIPDDSENTPNIQKIPAREENGVLVDDLFINGALFVGKPTTIYAWYARPKGVGKFPGSEPQCLCRV